MSEMQKRWVKTIIAMSAVTIILCSCIKHPEATEVQLQEIRKIYERAKGEQTAAKFYKSTFSGHSYIVFYDVFQGRRPVASILHDPDCPCQKGGNR